MYPRKKLSDYQELAKSKGLEFLDAAAPRRITEKANWLCTRCGRSHHKSWTTVMYNKNPCRCWNGIQVPEQDYKAQASALSKRFGLTISYIPGDYIARNVFQSVSWRISETDEIFEECYFNLHYNGVCARVKDILKRAKDADSERSSRAV